MLYNTPTMALQKDTTITIIGAGIAGAFLAILLAKRGYKVIVYERTSENELSKNASSRSFNLTFYSYAVSVLKKAGIWEAIEPTLVRTVGSITQVTQDPPVSRFNPTGAPQYVVQRALILKTLINEALRFPNVTFHFSTALVALDRKEKTILIQDLKTKKHQTVSCDIIVGADGVNSQVRLFMQQRQVTKHIQEYADWEYKQVSFSPERVKELGFKENTIYAWTRKHAALLAHPNQDKSFSALLMLPTNPHYGFQSLASKEVIERFIAKQFKDLLPAMPEMAHDILKNPRGQFVTIYTEPWYYKDFMVLIGDAAHGFSPFYGQGMSAAFTDCMELDTLIEKYGDQWQKVFATYQENRKKHTDALADLSKETLRLYIRYKKADYGAVYNKVESLLSTLLPSIFPTPASINIAYDPGHTADHVAKHTKQRRLYKMLGISLLVGVATGIIGLHENITKALHSKH